MFSKLDGFSFKDMMNSYANYIWENTTQKVMNEEPDEYFKQSEFDVNMSICDISDFANAYYDVVVMDNKMIYMVKYLP